MDEVLRNSGLEGLKQLPYVGETIACAIRELVTHGRLPMLDRLRGEADPVRLLASAPGIGRMLANRLHEELGLETLAELEAAAHDGRLATAHRRLDPDIFAAARKALDDDPRVPQDVRVHVDRGTVTLTGTVRWPNEKSEAEGIVRHIDGVQRVVNTITVANAANPEGFEAPESS